MHEVALNFVDADRAGWFVAQLVHGARDRRSAPRLRTSAQVDVRAPTDVEMQGFGLAMMQDVSRRGASLQLAHPLPLDKLVEVCVEVSEALWSIYARVVRSRPCPGRGFDVGVEFEEQWGDTLLAALQQHGVVDAGPEPPRELRLKTLLLACRE